MPASKELRKYIEEELPYRLLIEMYKDSRRSLKELGRTLHISHHTIAKTLKYLEEKYKILYTLDIDTEKLGFSEGRVITIKFGSKPSHDFLKSRFQKDVFVQNAYLATGDFDLLLSVVGLTSKDFMSWQWKLRRELGAFKPLLKISTINNFILGFLPIKNDLIECSTVLSEVEKRVLKLLNENSRIKLSELVKKSKTTQMKAIYALRRMQEEGIIKKYTALTQNPEKRILAVHTLSLTPTLSYKEGLLKVITKIISEDLHKATSDFDLIVDTVGAFDEMCVNTFENGEQMAERGPDMYATLLSAESAKTERSILTDILVGRWPFHLDDYGCYRTQKEGR